MWNISGACEFSSKICVMSCTFAKISFFFCIPMSVDAIMAIKLEYKVKKNWMGDPCFPADSIWDGVKCRNASDNIFRIISM